MASFPKENGRFIIVYPLTRITATIVQDRLHFRCIYNVCLAVKECSPMQIDDDSLVVLSF
jgi:hypothetical protein